MGGARGPGIFFIIPCIDRSLSFLTSSSLKILQKKGYFFIYVFFRYHKVDLRTITLGVPPQEVLLLL